MGLSDENWLDVGKYIFENFEVHKYSCKLTLEEIKQYKDPSWATCLIPGKAMHEHKEEGCKECQAIKVPLKKIYLNSSKLIWIGFCEDAREIVIRY